MLGDIDGVQMKIADAFEDRGSVDVQWIEFKIHVSKRKMVKLLGGKRTQKIFQQEFLQTLIADIDGSARSEDIFSIVFITHLVGRQVINGFGGFW